MSFRTGRRMVRKLKRYGGRGRRSAPVAVKALKKVNRLKRQIGSPEVKYITATSASFQQITNTGYQSSLITAIPQGTTNDDRIGDKIRGKYIDFRMMYANPAGWENNLLRVVIVRDKFSKGSTPLLLNNGTTTEQCIVQPLDYQIVHQQFEVIYDRTFNFLGQSQSDESCLFRRVVIPVNKKICFDTGTTTVVENNYRIYAWSRTLTAGTTPAILWNATLYYTDA